MNNQHKLNVLNIVSYYPPHQGGMEINAFEWVENWVDQGFGEVVTVTSCIDQNTNMRKYEKIYHKSKDIGYSIGSHKVIILPCFEIVFGFPIPNIFSYRFYVACNYISSYFKYQIIHTHTRFFLSTFLGGLIALLKKKIWLHTEYGSSYVASSNRLVTLFSYLYDITIGAIFVFYKSSILVGVSMSCIHFISKFTDRKDVSCIYRKTTIPNALKDIKDYGERDLKKRLGAKHIIGYVGRLYKWKNVKNLIDAFIRLPTSVAEKTFLVVVGSGPEYDHLSSIARGKNIYFTGGVSFEESILLQKQFDVHVHCSSPGGGLANTLLQAMELGCTIVSTPNEGGGDVIETGKNGFLLEDDSIESLYEGIRSALGILNSSSQEYFSIENKKIIKEKFQWNRAIREYYQLILDNSSGKKL